MTHTKAAADTIRAAIDKLEAERDAAADVKWHSWTLSRDGNNAGIYGVAELGDISSEDAELIVTLHRTIDAQLAWMRSGLAAITPGDDTTEEITESALDIARAILGGE